jgi:hypothetical protein
MSFHASTYEELITEWFKRSQKEGAREFTIFDQFMSLWLSFNAWGTYKSKKDKDSSMLNWVKVNTDLRNTHIRLMKDDDEYSKRVAQLSQYNVLDMRPSHKGQSKSVSNVNSLDELLDVIYQIRCNLFHGQKSEIDPHDRELVDLAFHILSKLFNPLQIQIA